VANTARLRVAVDAAAAQPGGGVSYLMQQLPALIDSGADLLVFAQQNTAETLRAVLPAAAFVAVPDALAPRMAFIHLAMPAAARRWGADVLYCPGSAIPLLCDLPTVVNYQNSHVFSPEKLLRGPAMSVRRVLAWVSAIRATRVVHLSQASAADFYRTTQLRVPVEVIWSGASDVESAHQHPAPADGPAVAARRRPYLIAVSNLYRHKRTDRLVRAFLSDSTLRAAYDLVIVGQELEPGITDEIRQLVSAAPVDTSAGTPGEVRLVGYLDGADLGGLLRDAAAYVSLSERESFALTPAEALLAGTPVVLSTLPAFLEAYGEWAVFVDSTDPADVASGIRTAVANRPSEDTRAEVRYRLSWEVNGQALLQVLVAAAGDGVPTLADSLRRLPLTRLPTVARTLLVGQTP
jgi:glycosyltransferase involved in cell wall biosynthesis